MSRFTDRERESNLKREGGKSLIRLFGEGMK